MTEQLELGFDALPEGPPPPAGRRAPARGAPAAAPVMKKHGMDPA